MIPLSTSPLMAISAYVPQSKSYLVFLNVSFVLLFGLFCKSHFLSSESLLSSSRTPNLALTTSDPQESCKQLQKLKDYKAKCVYLKTQSSCDTSGYIDYLYLFYCLLGNWPSVGFTLVSLWLLVLFYLLGDTASVYFCSSLEGLSKLLKLSPTIAGVTLLSLGNGAPDVFASLVSFVGTGSRSVGVNSVLGGAFFVSCIVVGVICLVAAPCRIVVKKSDFIRDVCFLILGLLALLLILAIGKINLWGALAFACLYFVYVFIVYKTHVHPECDIEDAPSPPIRLDTFHDDELHVPILRNLKSEELSSEPDAFQDNNEDYKIEDTYFRLRSWTLFGWFIYIIGLPLSIPRRLTIPVVFEENWSKPFAVASVTIAPMLLAVLCDSQMSNMGFKTKLAVYLMVGVLGVFFGVIAFFTTETSNPPQKFLLPWLIGGFAMSVCWSYITANELVALLVSIGYILGISPSILGLTVLAWGNSLGDLITNVAMAIRGGAEGTQIAISGCYAGPIFNLLIGLGLSQIVSTWQAYPSSVIIADDLFLLETMGFLVIGLLWALVVLPWRKMKLDRFLGVGLLVIYFVCICLRIVQTLRAA